MKYYNFCRHYDKWLNEYEKDIYKVNSPTNAEVIFIDIKSLDLSMYPNVQYVVCPCTNINHINNPNNVKIFSLKDETKFLKEITSTAEHTFRLMLELMRPINPYWKIYSRPYNPGNSLKGKKLGIIGYGRIGKQVAQIAKVFGMSVITCDITNRNYKTQFNNILKNSDIISIHASIKKDQKPILGIKELTSIRKGSYLINTSRGEAIDERALLATASNFAGIGLDVVVKDDFENTELRQLNNCIITNHIGGYTIEDLEKTFRFCTKKLIKELK